MISIFLLHSLGAATVIALFWSLAVRRCRRRHGRAEDEHSREADVGLEQGNTTCVARDKTELTGAAENRYHPPQVQGPSGKSRLY